MSLKKRKGIVIHLDSRTMLSCLSFEEVGRLLLALLDYAADGVTPSFGGGLQVAFAALRAQIDRDEEKYNDKCRKNAEYAALRWNKDSVREI